MSASVAVPVGIATFFLRPFLGFGSGAGSSVAVATSGAAVVSLGTSFVPSASGVASATFFFLPICVLLSPHHRGEVDEGSGRRRREEAQRDSNCFGCAWR